MTTFKERLWKLVWDESGQSTTEYILILSAVVMIAMKFRQKIGGHLDKMVDKIGSDIQDNLNTN